jgi:hypothetical protein
VLGVLQGVVVVELADLDGIAVAIWAKRDDLILVLGLARRGYEDEGFLTLILPALTAALAHISGLRHQLCSA